MLDGHIYLIVDFNFPKKNKFMGNLIYREKREFQILKRKEKELDKEKVKYKIFRFRFSVLLVIIINPLSFFNKENKLFLTPIKKLRIHYNLNMSNEF